MRNALRISALAACLGLFALTLTAPAPWATAEKAPEPAPLSTSLQTSAAAGEAFAGPYCEETCEEWFNRCIDRCAPTDLFCEYICYTDYSSCLFGCVGEPIPL